MNILALLNRALNGRIPRYVYALYKKRAIVNALNNRLDPCNANVPFGYLLDERIVEYPWLFSRLNNLNGKLLDAGSVLNFHYLLSRPELSAKDIFISTLAPEKHAYWHRGISYVYEDMRDICYKDNYFDCIACLSVLEHVGMDNTMLYTSDPLKKEKTPTSFLSVVSELHRVLKPGGVLFISVPFGEQRNYGWLQIFNGGMIDSIVDTFKPLSYSESYLRYLDNGWEASSRVGVSNCQYYDLHDKSRAYRDDRAIAAEGVVLLELKK